jgi:hypothetical protein
MTVGHQVRKTGMIAVMVLHFALVSSTKWTQVEHRHTCHRQRHRQRREHGAQEWQIQGRSGARKQRHNFLSRYMTG